MDYSEDAQDQLQWPWARRVDLNWLPLVQTLAADSTDILSLGLANSCPLCFPIVSKLRLFPTVFKRLREKRQNKNNISLNMKLLEIKISVSIFAVVQSLSQVWLCNPMDCSMPGFPVYQHLLEFAQTHVHWVGSLMPSNHLILCCPLLLLHSSLSQHLGLFQWVFHIRWPRYWSFSFSTSPTNE